MSLPASFVECCQSLEQGGMAPDRACRACTIAFWDAHGMTPEAAEKWNLDPGGSIADKAYMSSIELSGKPVNLKLLPHFQVGSEFEIPLGRLEKPEVHKLFDTFEWKPQPTERRRLFREVRFLSPGKWNGFDFTDGHLRNFSNNYSRLANPPIILDHEWSIHNASGYIRALRYQEGFTETDSVLYALWEFLGVFACDKVEDGLWKRVSGGFLVPKDPAQQRVYEGSVVLLGAYDNGPFDRAQILGGHNEMSTGNTPSTPQVTPVAVNLSTPAAPAPAPAPAQGGAPPEPAPPAAPAPATAPAVALALPPELSSVLVNLTNAVTQLNANQVALATEVANLGKESAEQKQLDRTRLDEAAHSELVRMGKSTPGLKEKELSILVKLSGKEREDYLEMRRELPTSTWPARNRQYPGAGVSLAQPGGDPQAVPLGEGAPNPEDPDDMLGLAEELNMPIQTTKKEGK